MMTRMPDLSRRAVLRLGAGAAAGALGTYALDRLLPARPPLTTPVTMAGTGVPLAPHPPLEPAPAPVAAPTMVTGSFVSAARGGIATNWAIARPPGQTKPLRPVIALHGKGSSAATVMDGGVEQGLAQAVRAGLPPFAVVAVDGGGSYWHKRASGDDAGAMVLNELIP
ncbi:MAG: alpha/beta hydrolase, partial [Mycobacterium sp.]|nr:alpha/beta hydrolase [Mycobacterium sp.]